MRTAIILFLLGFFMSCASNGNNTTVAEEYTFPVEAPGRIR